MKIPTGYIGHWVGDVTIDVLRKKSYPSEIVITSEGVESTTYHMKEGIQRGELTPLYDASGFLMLAETVGSFRGTLLIYSDVTGNLKCVWRTGLRFSSEATMTKVETDPAS